MVSLQTRISRLPFATLIGWMVCTVALLAQTAQPPVFPNAPQGFDAPRQGIATGRVERVEYISLGDWREEAGHGVHPAGLLLIAEVSGALPAARDRRQRDALVRTGCGRRHPRQPDRRQEGRADDRRDAARPLLERAGDITLWWTWWTRRARCHPRDGRSRTGPRGSAARGRRRSRRDSGWPRRRCDGGRVPGVRGVRARAAG